MTGGEIAQRKQDYFSKLIKLLSENQVILTVGVDNVGSNQLQQVRRGLKGKATILMGKNTMIRKAIRGMMKEQTSLEQLLPLIKGNCGLVFCHDELPDIKKKIESYKKPAAAKSGAIAPNDVTIPAGPTTLEPTKTSFFQALNINTKITKGAIEILQEVPLIKKDQKVGSSEATLLQMLKITPFQYGLQSYSVYNDGEVYPASILDVDDDEIVENVQEGIQNIAALSLAIGYPSMPAVPHQIIKGFKNVLAIGLATEYTFPKAEEVKEMLKNPGNFAPAATTTTETKKEEAKKEEPEEEEDDDMGFGLFD